MVVRITNITQHTVEPDTSCHTVLLQIPLTEKKSFISDVKHSLLPNESLATGIFTLLLTKHCLTNVPL